MTPLTESDLNLYLKAIDKAKVRFSCSDTTEHNHGLLNSMAWGAIQRHHAPLCPNCGPCYGDCDNCAYCLTDQPNY
jgi:hypothetical protein